MMRIKQWASRKNKLFKDHVKKMEEECGNYINELASHCKNRGAVKFTKRLYRKGKSPGAVPLDKVRNRIFRKRSLVAQAMCSGKNKSQGWKSSHQAHSDVAYTDGLSSSLACIAAEHNISSTAASMSLKTTAAFQTDVRNDGMTDE